MNLNLQTLALDHGRGRLGFRCLGLGEPVSKSALNPRKGPEDCNRLSEPLTLTVL